MMGLKFQVDAPSFLGKRRILTDPLSKSKTTPWVVIDRVSSVDRQGRGEAPEQAFGEENALTRLCSVRTFWGRGVGRGRWPGSAVDRPGGPCSGLYWM